MGLAFAAAVLAELPYVNGPSYWVWSWRSIRLDRALVCFALPLVLYGYTFWRWTTRTSVDRREAAKLVTLLAVCCLLFQLAGAYAEGKPWQRIRAIVRTPYITSYYTDALKIRNVRRFLDGFSEKTIDDLEYHSATHPPGPILYYYALRRTFGSKQAATIGGVTIAVLASLGVALLYRFARLWTDDRNARLGPCFLYACLPGLIVFLPELDQVYPLVSMGMLWLWARSLDERTAAIGLGVVLFIATFSAYNLLTMGVPMVLLAAYRWHGEHWSLRRLGDIALSAGLALAVFATLHLGLYLWTSYEALGSLMAALRAQVAFDERRIAEGIIRPYHMTVFFDLYDFVLAGGILTLPLALGELSSKQENSARRSMTALALLTILLIDLTGLLPCETARVWLFMQPLIVVPAGLQLARLTTAERSLVLGMFVTIAILVKCKMEFLTV